MNPATQMMIDREISRYKRDLADWARRVQAQRTALDAFRTAAHRPNPGSLAASLRHLANSDRMRADQAVERVLTTHADAIDTTDGMFPTILRLSQGHWPRIYRLLDERRQRAVRPAG